MEKATNIETQIDDYKENSAPAFWDDFQLGPPYFDAEFFPQEPHCETSSMIISLTRAFQR